MSTNMTGPIWLSKIFVPFALDESSLDIGRVKPFVHIAAKTD